MPTSSRRKRRIIHGSVTRYGPRKQLKSLSQRYVDHTWKKKTTSLINSPSASLLEFPNPLPSSVTRQSFASSLVHRPYSPASRESSSTFTKKRHPSILLILPIEIPAGWTRDRDGRDTQGSRRREAADTAIVWCFSTKGEHPSVGGGWRIDRRPTPTGRWIGDVIRVAATHPPSLPL